MAKRLRVIGNERIGLEDFVHGTVEYPAAELRSHLRRLLTDLAAVVSGFEVAIDDAAGPNVIRVYNGAALDPSQQLVHVEDVPSSVAVLALEGAGKHHVGIIFRLVPSDTDARQFWDPDVLNPDLSKGREFTQEIRTRFSATWQPVVSLNDSSFASAPGVGANAALVIPLSVIPVVPGPGGVSQIDTTALLLERPSAKVVAFRSLAGPPAQTAIQVVDARLLRVGSELVVPTFAPAPPPAPHTIDALDPARNEAVVSPPLSGSERNRARRLGFVLNTGGYRFIRNPGQLRDPGTDSDPGDIRPRFFEGEIVRGERLLSRPADNPNRLGADALGVPERLTGREEDLLGAERNFRDALAFVLAELKFGLSGTHLPDGAFPRWLDPVPVSLWEIARLYFQELNGTGLAAGGIQDVTVAPLAPPTPGSWSATTRFLETIFYANGIRHRLAATARTDGFSSAGQLVFVHWWAVARKNTNPITGPLANADWPTAPVEILQTQSAAFEIAPPKPAGDPERTVLLGTVKFDKGPPGSPTAPTATVLDVAPFALRVADRLAFDSAGRIQRDLRFRHVPGVGDPGRTLRPDHAGDDARLNVDLAAGQLKAKRGGTIDLQDTGTGPAPSVRCREGGPGSAVGAQLDRTGLDLSGAGTAVRLRQSGSTRGRLEITPDPGGGLEDLGDVPALVGPAVAPPLLPIPPGGAMFAPAPPTPGAARIGAADAKVGSDWKDGVAFTDAEVFEARRRLRSLGQLAFINVDRTAAGDPDGATQGFNFVNPYKVPLAWAHVAFSGTGAAIHSQSHYMNSNGRATAGGDRITRYLRAFKAPVFAAGLPGMPAGYPPGSFHVLSAGPASPLDGAVRVFQLPWADQLRVTRDADYVVTVHATPTYDKWINPNFQPSTGTNVAIGWTLGAIWIPPSAPLGEVLDPRNGPIVAYTWPWVEGVMIQVWNTLGKGKAPADPAVTSEDTYLRSV